MGSAAEALFGGCMRGGAVARFEITRVRADVRDADRELADRVMVAVAKRFPEGDLLGCAYVLRTGLKAP